ncbi:hypothetical protein Pla110_21950 [Polystyrenella longa]|uniref:Uncharacterized protein n=1 Tax=Polystyrenella longa TaxID=2528007 RepID=A0A518CML3_9PLAN|nr:hypothetical protein [Polystyrenella longa]QDU80465.1 hypothetical protein Pla110_21950 [Polystyrenella longa]
MNLENENAESIDYQRTQLWSYITGEHFKNGNRRYILGECRALAREIDTDMTYDGELSPYTSDALGEYVDPKGGVSVVKYSDDVYYYVSRDGEIFIDGDMLKSLLFRSVTRELRFDVSKQMTLDPMSIIPNPVPNSQVRKICNVPPEFNEFYHGITDGLVLALVHHDGVRAFIYFEIEDLQYEIDTYVEKILPLMPVGTEVVTCSPSRYQLCF